MRHPVRALVAILAVIALTTGLSTSATAAPAATANECAAHLQIMYPHQLYSHMMRKFIIMGQVYLAAEGNPCVGHNLKISLDVRPTGSTGAWQTRATRDYGYDPLGSDDLGLRLHSWFIDRECAVRYRSRYVLDDSITVIESTDHQYC